MLEITRRLKISSGAAITRIIVISMAIGTAIGAVNADQHPGTAVASPIARLVSGHLLYHEAQGRLLMAGAYPAPSAPELLQLWEWDHSAWRLLQVPSAPPMRTVSAAVYDSRRQRIVLHGGLGNKGLADPRSDTWEWDGKMWSQISATGAGSRDHHSMAYDETRGRAVMHGGVSSVAGPGGTVRESASNIAEWDGRTWVEIAAPDPGPRGGAAMVFDRERQGVVLFGGFSISSSADRFRDTWLWNGKVWLKASDDGPVGRNGHAMVFDRRAGRVLMWGGTTGGSHLDDFWQWNGQRWTEIAVSGPRPAPRVGAQMVYDVGRQRVILYGGRVRENGQVNESNEMWEWDGVRWARAS